MTLIVVSKSIALPLELKTFDDIVRFVEHTVKNSRCNSAYY